MKDKPFGVIYEIIFPNGKRYIGQTIQPDIRFDKYRRLDCKGQRKFHNALLKYGWENTVCSILYECDNMDELNTLEEITIAQYKTRDIQFGYNIAKGGKNREISEETRIRMSQSKKDGYASGRLTNNNKGKISSEETRRKIGESSKGRKASDETKKKMSAAQKGKIVSEEGRRNMSQAMRGVKKNLSPEQRQKLVDRKKGTKMSEETRKKMSESRKRAHALGIGPNLKGKPNVSSMDLSIYSFQNKDGRVFKGTRGEFEIAFGFKKCSACCIVKGDSKTYKGWFLIQSAPL